MACLLSRGDKVTSHLRKLLTIFLVLLNLQVVFADTEKVIEFENQREENFDLENWLKEITYTTEQREGTCYRTEYRSENVCRNVTRYRQECHTEPSRQECRQVNDPICSTETRYERECHQVPGEQQCRVVVRYRQECSTGRGERECRTIPGDVQCRIINGENRCTKIPPREECSDRPGRQECRQVPYEERECTTGSSRQECRDVPRQHQVCRDNYRTVCETIPAHRVCNQVPYQEQVCGMEQVPYQVPYTCMQTVQVPHEKILKTHKARVEVEFDAKGSNVQSKFKVALSNKGTMDFSLADSQRDVLAFLNKEIKTEAQGDINNISALYKVALYNRVDLFNLPANALSALVLKKESLNFNVKGKFEQKRASLALKVMKKDEILCEKTLKSSQFKSVVTGETTKVSIDLGSVGCKVAGSVMFNKTRTVGLKLKLDFADLGESVGGAAKDISTSVSKEVEIE